MRRGWDVGDGAFGRLADRRSEVMDALVEMSGGTQKLLGVKGDHLDRALTTNSSLRGSATLPAWRRYTGVVWDHLDPTTLTTTDRRRIVVVSGLLGLVRGDDPVPDYRLKMGASPAPLGRLSTWWRKDLSETLNHYATGRTSNRPRLLVDLLPKEHRAAWVPDGRVTGVSIELVDRTGAPGGHFAKAAKGRLAREILLHGLGALDEWSDERFDVSVTSIRRPEASGGIGGR